MPEGPTRRPGTGQYSRKADEAQAKGAHDMTSSPMTKVLHQFRWRALAHDRTGLTDGQLLDCFVARRDEAAFEALVRRHGPMVLGACRRIAGHMQDAEDAFQATFLVLVRKAAGLRSREL